jgi:trigger factor
MNLEVEETGPVERKLRIEISTADVDAAFDGVYRELGQQAHLRGFRRGKAPRSVLERTFGSRARGQVLERLVQETLLKAVGEAKLDVVGEPRLEPEGEPKQGSPYVYEAHFEIRPEIELRAIRGLEVEVPAAQEPATDEDPVEKYLEELRAAHTQLVAEPEGTLAARGQVAVIDYQATIDGEPFEGGSGDETEIEIGSGRAIAGFEEQLEGLVVDGEREFDLALPDTYPEESAAGKTAHFSVKLVELKRQELPALDDEFAKDVSEFETVEALREDLQRRLEEGREAEKKQRIRQAVLDKLIELNPFPVPASLVERQLISRISRAAGSLEGRVPPEELRKMVERWREEWREAAEREVRFGFLIPEIAEGEGMQVADEEVEARLREEADAQGQPVSQVRRKYKEQGLLEVLRAQLLEDRVVEFLVAEATLSGV